MSRITIWAISAFIFSPITFAASFDCAKAHSVQEVLICSDPTLSRADEQLAEAYKRAASRTSNKSALLHSQREWLKSYEVSACKQADCLQKVFVEREKLLNRVPTDDPSALWTGTYVRLFHDKSDPSATITLLGLTNNHILVSGNAQWVGSNPGQVNTGEMAGEAISIGTKASLDADGCTAQFALEGMHLIVNSEEGCGGLNVSFAGKYKRK